MGILRSLLLLLLLLLSNITPAGAAEWELLPLWGDKVHVVAGSDPAVVYAVADDRLFESFDGGRTWQLAAAGLSGGLSYPLEVGGVLKVDPEDSRRLYLTVPQHSSGSGVLRSDDGGRTWMRSDEGVAGLGVTDLAFGPPGSGVIHAATSGGLYRSRDRGMSWSLLAFPGQSVRHVTVAPSDPRIVLASGWNGTTLWTRRSTNGGRTFVRVLKKSVERFAFDPRRPGRLIGVALGNHHQYEVVRSDDLGAHWKVVSPLPLPLDVLAFTPGGVLLGASDLRGISRSADGGVTWSPPLLGGQARPEDLVTSLVVFDNLLLAGGHRGVWRSGRAGRSWSLSNEGIQNQGILAVKVAADADSTVWAGTTTGLFLSRDQGETFQPYRGLGSVRYLTVHPMQPETVYAFGCCFVNQAGRSTVGMLKTQDGGRSWRGLPYPGPRSITVLETDPADPDIVYAGGFYESGRSCRAWRSLDGGETWTCIRPTGEDFVDLAIDPRDPSLLYGLFNGEPYRSEDRGTNWSKLPAAGSLLWQIEIDPVRADRLYAFAQGVLRSDDGGATWSTILPILPGGYIPSFVVDPWHPGRLWASRGNQILRSDDAGDSWVDASAGLDPGAWIRRLEVDPQSPDVLYGVDSLRGLYRLR